ncbi:hypothetical protein JNUCC1_01576 [Lentibacillus sp. JNUCC-1]|uniref:hypothetical protein n=1 Tax=Lentibacillus sp. JNUCC-1 TaxID=2654513 RepID=UPI0012E929B8|nr:hypothetical protein [Lentibacillus sp. JNUCC-1]MUV37770.1 hypothetical protein [Lentibacillus sp. JNUCC-1]
MSEHGRRMIQRENEMRTEEISRMIDEGGLGADKYYDILKSKTSDINSYENVESQWRSEPNR